MLSFGQLDHGGPYLGHQGLTLHLGAVLDTELDDARCGVMAGELENLSMHLKAREGILPSVRVNKKSAIVRGDFQVRFRSVNRLGNTKSHSPSLTLLMI